MRLGRSVLAARSVAPDAGVRSDPPGRSAPMGGEERVIRSDPAWCPGEVVQGALFGGSPRVLSCSRLRDANAGSDTVFFGEIGVSPGLVVRSDDVGRSFVYSRPRLAPVAPSQKGRVYRTDYLSSKGARVIQGASLKAVQIGQPFRAIWQPTVSEEFVSEFLPADGVDGVQKPCRTLSDEFRRFWHWVTDYCAVNGHKRPVYAYTCESKSDGDRDYHPHIHVLTSLVMCRDEFEEFAPLAEAAWGLGSVHMEVIKRPKNAGAYLLKAARYSVKGTISDQGRVWGRRWSVSRAVRPVERRDEVPLSGGDAYELEACADLLRDLRKQSARTPFGNVTVRGFYPGEGFSAESLWLAVAYARTELEQRAGEVIADAEMDSSFLRDQVPKGSPF